MTLTVAPSNALASWSAEASSVDGAPVVSMDEVAVAAARRGDPQGFARVHERYARMVHAILLSRRRLGLTV